MKSLIKAILFLGLVCTLGHAFHGKNQPNATGKSAQLLCERVAGDNGGKGSGKC